MNYKVTNLDTLKSHHFFTLQEAYKFIDTTTSTHSLSVKTASGWIQTQVI
jgi:hypothetical protein